MKKRLSLCIALATLLGVGLYAFAAPAPAAHAAPPASHTMIRTSGSSASASFHFERDDVMGNVFVQASPEGFQFSPTESFPGPAVQVSIDECNTVTTECLFGGNMVPAPGLQMDTKKLTSATLPQVTVPVDLMNESGMIVTSSVVTVALTWTGVGGISTESGVFHLHTPHMFSQMFHFKGVTRDATVSGAVSYSSPLLNETVTLTGDDIMFAQLMSSGSTVFSIQRA